MTSLTNIRKQDALKKWQIKADLPQVTIRSIIVGLIIGYVLFIIVVPVTSCYYTFLSNYFDFISFNFIYFFFFLAQLSYFLISSLVYKQDGFQ